MRGSPKLTTFEWGWSYWQRLDDPRTLEARDEKHARKLLRDRFNLRSTRGLSIVAADSEHSAAAVAARRAARRP